MNLLGTQTGTRLVLAAIRCSGSGANRSRPGFRPVRVSVHGRPSEQRLEADQDPDPARCHGHGIGGGWCRGCPAGRGEAVAVRAGDLALETRVIPGSCYGSKPSPRSLPLQEPPGRNRPVAFTLYYKVCGPLRPPFAGGSSGLEGNRWKRSRTASTRPPSRMFVVVQ